MTYNMKQFRELYNETTKSLTKSEEYVIWNAAIAFAAEYFIDCEGTDYDLMELFSIKKEGE